MELEKMATTGCMLVKPADRVVAAIQTPGMLREEAVKTQQLWSGIARTASGNVSGWHHHGNWETVAYVISGAVHLECGTGGRMIIDAEPGDFLLIPKGEIHRESNPTGEEQHLVIFRAGSGPVVVDVDAPLA